MSDINNIITDNIDIWTSAIQKKKAVGRGSSKKHTLYGIKKLRELILELAIRGKLVPQDPTDEPATELLKRITVEKETLINDKKIKKPKKLPEITEEEMPFEIPDGWTYSYLPDLCYYNTGKTPSTKNPSYWDNTLTGIPWVSISDMSHYGEISQTNKQVSNFAAESVFKYETIKAGTILMSFKLTVGKISILKIDAYHNEAIISINPFSGLEKMYLFSILPNIALGGNTKKAIMGNTLNSDSLAKLIIPLPPENEQKRIVSKVNELMTLCDKLEQQTEDSITAHKTLVVVLLNTLTNSKDHNELTTNWNRMSDHFDSLFTTEESIDLLKNTILQLAVMGKLVPQDQTDEPASVLLENIKAEKEQLIKDKKIKKSKKFPEITEEEKPFDIPDNWKWTKMGIIIHDLRYGTSKKCTYKVTEYPVLRIPNISKGFIDCSDLKYADLNKQEAEDLILVEDDIIIIRSNGSPNLVGRTAVINNISRGISFAGYLIRCRKNNSYLHSAYFNYLFGSKLIRSIIEPSLRTTSGVKNINAAEISNLPFALPPINEQNRIVLKVDELMTICDSLSNKLQDERVYKVLLADSLQMKV